MPILKKEGIIELPVFEKWVFVVFVVLLNINILTRQIGKILCLHYFTYICNIFTLY